MHFNFFHRLSAVLAIILLLHADTALAATYGGGSVISGIREAFGLIGFGGGSIQSFIGRLTSSLRSIVNVLGVLAIVVAGMYLLLGFGDEGAKDRAKKIVIYTMVGIIIVNLAEVIVNLFIGLQDGTIGGDVTSFIKNLTSSLRSFATIVGVLAIVIAGFYLLLGFGDEGAKDRAKKIVIYTLIGILLITLADVIVAIFQDFQLGNIGGDLRAFIVNLTASLRSIVYIVAVFAIIVAGFYLLLGFGSESAKDTAKRIIIYTLVGVLIISLAEVIVNLFVGLQGGNIDLGVVCYIYNILLQAVSYVALIGTIAIIVAGFYLLLGFGSESAKDTAQRIIIYTIVGILIITFAAAIVGIVFAVAGTPANLAVCGSSYPIPGIGGSDFRSVIISILDYALSFLALLAVVALVIAGFMLILGLGSESSRDRAFRIVIYTIIGLLVIFFARVVVAFLLGLSSSI